MIRNKFIPPAAEKVWPQKLNISQYSLDWKEIWKKVINTNIDHEDKDLWFRLRHRIPPTNAILKKMRMVNNNNKCGLCKQEEETIEHLFIYCKNTWIVWLFIENTLRKYKGYKHFYLLDSNTILGYGKHIDDIALFLIAKLHRTVWVTRCKQLIETSPIRDSVLLNMYKNERIIVLENKRLSPNDFIKIFTRNKALCYLYENSVTFSFM